MKNLINKTVNDIKVFVLIAWILLFWDNIYTYILTTTSNNLMNTFKADAQFSNDWKENDLL